jgi:hypothetical protein
MQRAPKSETADNLGHRLDRLNVLTIRWLAGEIARSMQSAKSSAIRRARDR